MIESGRFYGTAIDPLLTRLRKHVSSEISTGEQVIDIACGTGSQVFDLAGKTSRAVGIDLSASMIHWANKKSLQKKLVNTKFYTADAGNLGCFRDLEFDVAVMSLALHQFNPEAYAEIIGEMKRIAKKIVITDYSVPLPSGIWGKLVRIIETLAGREHFRNFRKFVWAGGLIPIAQTYGLKIIRQKQFAHGIFILVVMEK